MNEFFGGYKPKYLNQDFKTGRNNIQSATAASYTAGVFLHEVDLQTTINWFYDLENLIQELNDKNKHTKIRMYNFRLFLDVLKQ